MHEHQERTGDTNPESVSEAMLTEALAGGRAAEQVELLRRWLEQEEAKNDALEDGPERGRARIELIIRQAELLLATGNRDEGLAALDQAWFAAANEDHRELMSHIEGLLKEHS